MKKRVDAYALLCLPDLVYLSDKTQIEFNPIDIDEKEYPALFIHGAHAPLDKSDIPYVFSDWSRAQLFSRLGTTDKWFRDVSVLVQTEELNTRRHCLHKMMFRTIRSADEELHPYRAVRGLVSHRYSDIPDTYILSSLVDLMGIDAQIVRSISEKTWRALYVYLLAPDSFVVPGTLLRLRPGIVVKNSEVGYSSLTMTIMFFEENSGVPIVMKKHTLLKKVHRGRINNLPELFEEALAQAGVLWKTLQEKIEKLSDIQYSTQNVALEALAKMIKRFGWPKRVMRACTDAYNSSTIAGHSGYRVFDAVLRSVRTRDTDKMYDESALAGAVLLYLTT